MAFLGRIEVCASENLQGSVKVHYDPRRLVFLQSCQAISKNVVHFSDAPKLRQSRIRQITEIYIHAPVESPRKIFDMKLFPQKRTAKSFDKIVNHWNIKIERKVITQENARRCLYFDTLNKPKES